MKYRVTTSAVEGRYQAKVELYAFTQQEEELMAAHGEPEVDLGGDFEGTYARPGHTNTAILTTVNDSAELVPVIDKDGTITAITVVAGGNYSSTPALSATGAGTGFAATATRSGTAIVSVAVTNGGYGWQKTPVAVDFTLSERIAGFRTGFPAQQSFDLNDYADADVRMKAWYEEVVSRVAAAHAELMAKSVTYQGEIVGTL